MAELTVRAAAIRSGVWLEMLTVGWMLVEAVVALAAGIAAGSVLLIAFGADSIIELLSGATLLWRLRRESRDESLASVETAERRAVRVSAVLLVMLCVYVLVSSVAGLLLGIRPSGSWPGLVITTAALVLMPLLAWRKRVVNLALNSPALRADIAETISCAYLAAVTLAGLGVAALTGWWWVQYLAAILLLRWLLPETREAIEAAR
jgi:divalent metal cation (Fe/Co/Zn/Cd) transporter